MPPPAEDVTGLLIAFRQGDKEAADRLVQAVYQDLKKKAAAFLRRERRGHTLQPTALVHETYLRLIEQRAADWKNRTQFFAVAATAMRQILVDHARRHGARKRGGSWDRISFDESRRAWPGQPDVNILALEEALEDLAQLDPSKVRLVELRFFAGLDLEETAAVLGVSESTVTREWRLARAWLFRRLGGPARP
jgi:RNA polymerase sigma factor (TIGR02999 family)